MVTPMSLFQQWNVKLCTVYYAARAVTMEMFVSRPDDNLVAVFGNNLKRSEREQVLAFKARLSFAQLELVDRGSSGYES